jgi:hypothetical protein
MAAKRRGKTSTASSNSTVVDKTTTNESIKDVIPKKKEIVLADHLPPLGLVFTVLACSGALWVFGLRDLMATGKPFLGEIDDAYLVSDDCMCIRMFCSVL